MAHACRKLPGDIARGFQWRSLAPALEALAKQAPSPLLGLVYGSGFEDRPHLLTRLAERWPLLGNDAETVERIKAPETFFATLDALGIAYPPTLMERPAKGAGWVAKRRGGAGGSHVVPSRLQKDATDVYYQALVEGRAVSALFLANGSRARVLGFSEQWTAPAPRRPWRYGGAVQPASLPEDAADAMTRAVTALSAAFGLKGLASADFVLAENRPLLLEINPRPGATLDIFAGAKKPLAQTSRRCGPRRHASPKTACLRGRRSLVHRACAEGCHCAAQHDLALLGGRSATARRADRQTAPDMHCTGPRRD